MLPETGEALTREVQKIKMKVATLNYGPFQAALVGPLAPDHWPRRLTCISPKKV